MTLDDFDVLIDFPNSNQKHKEYLELSKLKGRYSSHKTEALTLINNNQKYSQSRLEEIARQIGISSEQVKKDIFGKELFDDDFKCSRILVAWSGIPIPLLLNWNFGAKYPMDKMFRTSESSDSHKGHDCPLEPRFNQVFSASPPS